jgi:hypothetical protein
MSLFNANEISEMSSMTWSRHQELEKVKLEKNIVPLLHYILDSVNTEKLKADLKDRCQDYTHVKDLRVSLCLLDLNFNGIPLRKLLKKTTVLARVANVLYPGHFEVKAYYNETSVFLEAHFFPKRLGQATLPCLCFDVSETPSCGCCGGYTAPVVNSEDPDYASMPELEGHEPNTASTSKKRRYSYSSE